MSNMAVISRPDCPMELFLQLSCDESRPKSTRPPDNEVCESCSESDMLVPSEVTELRNIVDTQYKEVICSSKYESCVQPPAPRRVENNFKESSETIALPAMLYKLLNTKTTENMGPRIATILHYFLESSAIFSIQDLADIADVLHLLLLKDAGSNNYYYDYTTKLPIKARETAVYGSNICHIGKENLQKTLQHYLTKLGESLMLTNDERIKVNIARVFLTLFDQPSKDEYAVKLEHLIVSLEKSTILKMFCDDLETFPHSVYIPLLIFFLKISEISQSLSLYLVSKGCIDIVIGRMTPDNPFNIQLTGQDIVQFKMEYRYLVQLSIALLDHLMLNYSQANLDIDIMISNKAVHHLMNMIERANRTEDDGFFTKKIRNQLLTVFVNLQKLFRTKGVQLAINQLHLANKIIFFDNISNGNSRKKHLHLKTKVKDDEDKIFEKVLLLSKYYILQFNSYPLSDEEKCHLALHCVPDMINDAEFLKYCFTMGRQFIPHLKKEFFETNSCEKLLQILRKFIKKSSRGKILFEVLKTLKLVTIMTDNDQILKYLKDHGINYLLINVCYLLLHENALKDQKTALIHTLQAMSRLIQNNIDDQNNYFEDFTNIFLRTIRIVQIKDTFNMTTDRELLRNVLIFLLKAIIPNSVSSELFIKSGLIYNLMDLLVLNDNIATENVLRILTDLCDCENRTFAIPFVLTWREPRSSKCFLSKVCDHWREYEFLQKTHRDVHGIIADVEFPLMGEFQREQLATIAINSSPSLLETRSSIRTNIFAIVDLLRDQTETVKRQYQIGADLDVKDRVTMVVIENYLLLKQHELWQEIVHTFHTHGIVMKDASADLIREISDNNKRRVEAVRDQQMEILNFQKKNARTNSEENLYKSIVEGQTHPRTCFGNI